MLLEHREQTGDLLLVVVRVDDRVLDHRVSKRRFPGPDGQPAHHLLDPATRRPAFTGVVQATALAPTATEAEALSKAALLSGPDRARGWLPHGGVVVHDDGATVVIEAPVSSLGVRGGRWPSMSGVAGRMTAASTQVSSHLFWIISRGAGTTALILASASICFGLAMSGSLIRRGRADGRIYHEMLSLSVMVAIAGHGLSLIGDSFLHPSLADVTVPFVSSYETLSTSLGIIAGWALILLGLSYYLRDRIGRQRWKLIHRLTLVAWMAGLVHTFTEGTDAGQIWFIALIVVTAAPAMMLLVLRLTGGRLPSAASRPQARPRLSSPRPTAPP